MMAVMEQDSKKPGSRFAAIKVSHWKENGMAVPIPYYIDPILGE